MIEKCKKILYSLLIISLMKKFFLIIILSLSTTTLSANDRDAELDKLFLELKKNNTIFIIRNLLNRYGCYGALILQIKN